MAEQRRFEAGQKILWLGSLLTVADAPACARLRSNLLWAIDANGQAWCPQIADCEPADTSPTADTVVEQPKVDPPYQKPPLGNPPYENPRIYDQDRKVRQWDSDKYTGLSDWTPLDQRIAAVKSEHTRQADSSGLLHPRSWWSGRNPGRRAR